MEMDKKAVEKLQEILSSIVKEYFDVSVTRDESLPDRLKDVEWPRELSHAIRKELDIKVTAEEIVSSVSISHLSALIDSRLERDLAGRSLVDVYSILERLTKKHLSHDVNYHWNANWMGDVLNGSDSLDDVEIVISIEREFEFSISDRDAQGMHRVGQTVRYLWTRASEQAFILRSRPQHVCERAFVFYELRRLLVVRGGLSRSEVRLEARLGELLPTWYKQFWEDVQRVFGINLPQSYFLTFGFGPEKNTTVRELVNLIVR